MTSGELYEWRQHNGYSQSQLAKALGVATMTVSRWERETREIPPFLYLALKSLPQKGGEIKKGRPVVNKLRKEKKIKKERQVKK